MGFPKYVYKRGTGSVANANGMYTAESALVNSEDELAALGWDWCDSPALAAEAKPVEKPKPVAAAKEAKAVKKE